MLKTQTDYRWKQLYYIISKKNGILKKTRDFEKSTGF